MTDQERVIARAAINDLARNDQASFNRHLQPQLVQKTGAVFAAMHARISSTPSEVTFVNGGWGNTGGSHHADAVYKVRTATSWSLVQISMQSANGQPAITSFYVQPTPGDPEKLNSFRLTNAGLGGSVMLLAMAVAIGTIIGALIKIWRSGMFHRRWLWTIGCLIGVTSFRLNWTTGAYAFQPVSIQLLGIGATKMPIYAPWILAVSIPFVAIFALFKSGYDTWEEPGIFPDDPAATES